MVRSELPKSPAFPKIDEKLYLFERLSGYHQRTELIVDLFFPFTAYPAEQVQLVIGEGARHEKAAQGCLQSHFLFKVADSWGTNAQQCWYDREVGRWKTGARFQKELQCCRRLLVRKSHWIQLGLLLSTPASDWAAHPFLMFSLTLSLGLLQLSPGTCGAVKL